MRKEHLFALLLAVNSGTLSAQTLTGDMNGDGRLTVDDIALLVDAVIAFDDDNAMTEAVDLGLQSGTLWACCNLGATAPEDVGSFFAWGETATKSSYTWGYYTWVDANRKSKEGCNKYTFDESETSGLWYNNGLFVGDGVTQLTPADDAALKVRGSNWRMPTCAEVQEIIDNCTWTRQLLNGRMVYQVEGKNGAAIFLPVTGFREGFSTYDANVLGYYWTSSLSTISSDLACCLVINATTHRLSAEDRYKGLVVRPVCDSKQRTAAPSPLPH